MFKRTLVILSSTALFGTPSNIFFHNTIFLVIKSRFLKSLRTKPSCLKQVFKIWSMFHKIAKF